jgi:hypothetical protein
MPLLIPCSGIFVFGGRNYSTQLDDDRFCLRVKKISLLLEDFFPRYPQTMHKNFFTPIDAMLSRVHNPLTSRI